MKRPIGQLIPDSKVDGYLSSLRDNGVAVVTVGDHTTRRCEDAGIKPVLEIIDYREKRSRTQTPENRDLPVTNVKNPPGVITEEAISTIRKLLSKSSRCRLVVDGEEDLLVIPCVKFSKQGTLVLYGQPNAGLVSVTVDEDAKRIADAYMKEMGWND